MVRDPALGDGEKERRTRRLALRLLRLSARIAAAAAAAAVPPLLLLLALDAVGAVRIGAAAAFLASPPGLALGAAAALAAQALPPAIGRGTGRR